MKGWKNDVHLPEVDHRRNPYSAFGPASAYLSPPTNDNILESEAFPERPFNGNVVGNSAIRHVIKVRFPKKGEKFSSSLVITTLIS